MTEAKEKKTLEDRLNDLSAKIRGLEQRLKDQFGIEVDLNKDGKIGKAHVGILVSIAMACFACVGLARDMGTAGFNDATYGTAMVTTDDAGTATLYVDGVVASGTVTAAAFSGPSTGDMTGDEIKTTPSEKLTVEFPNNSTNTVKGALVLQDLTTNTGVKANNAVEVRGTFSNSQDAVAFGTVGFRAVDVTTNSQDGAVYVKVQLFPFPSL